MFRGVAPSKLASQPVGEVSQVAEDVYQLKVPIPTPLTFVSAYLIEGDEGWTLLDTGFDHPEARAAWENGARSVGCNLDQDVSRIMVTHFHADHLGAARWLQRRSGAPVYMLESEIPHAREIWDGEQNADHLVRHLVRHGMDPDLAVRATKGWRRGLDLPEKILPLREGERVSLGKSSATVIRAPGHADHQFILFDKKRSILFAADHVLLKITPNISVWPDTEPGPLARFMEHLEKLYGMDVDLVLPGHGPVFHDLDGRVRELISHHEERLEAMRGELLEKPKTPYEVSLEVFRRNLSVYEHRFALVETLAHLEHLFNEGQAECMEDDVVRYYSGRKASC